MGQNSSKRRQRASGKSKSGNTDSGSHGKYEDINGSIEERQDKDAVNISSSGRHNHPASPTSLTSASPPKTPEKKEKRKRFRVGFSLKRTPSGRWSRKKKTTTQNGVRPVSCPEPLKGEQDLNPGRPQSLFLDDIQIEDEDNKIETVDLSDNEEGKASDVNKTAPKVPEKTKWRRGSNKKSSGKKKKKEKETSKKDKKKKQKNEETLTQTVNDSEASSEVVITTAKPTEKILEPIKVSDNGENATIRDLQQTEIDINKIASEIVSQSVKIAQERLRAESCNGASSIPLIDDEPEMVNTEINTLQCGRVASEGSGVAFEDCRVDVEDNHLDVADLPLHVADRRLNVADIPLQVADRPLHVADLPLHVADHPLDVEDRSLHVVLSSSQVKTADSAVKIAQDIIAEIMDKSVDVIKNKTDYMGLHPEVQSHEYGAEITESVDVAMLVKESEDKGDTEVEICKLGEESVQNEVDDPLKIKSYIIQENLDSVANTGFDNLDKKRDKNIEEYVSEMIAKQTVENVIAAALEVVRKEDFNKSNKHSENNDIQADCTNILLLSKNNTDECIHGQDKNNKENVDAGEQNTVVEAVNKVECIQVKEKAPEKSEKSKSKSDMKLKVQKKLSHWFHKKDKQPKSVSKIDNSTSTKEPTFSDEASECSKYTKDFSQKEMLESKTLSKNSSSPNSSLMLDVSVEPLAVTSTPSESSPASNEVTSQSASISPISITSDTSELESPSSIGDNKMESGSLKKISIGTRLRTAILRKKSSEVSDEVQETESFLLSPPKLLDCNALTPPPRKSRNRKSEESTPGTLDSHNLLASKDTTPQSPYEVIDSVIVYNSETEKSIIRDDSGFADLTSPESNQSYSCLTETTTDLASAPVNLEDTVDFVDSVQENSEDTGVVFDTVHDSSQEIGTVFDSARNNLKETVSVIDSAHFTSQETVIVLDSSHDISQKTVAVHDGVYANSQETVDTLASAHHSSQETRAVLDSAYVSSEEKESMVVIIDSARDNSEETAAVVHSERACPKESTIVCSSTHEPSVETEVVLESTYWNSEETADVLDSENRTSEETIPDFDSTNVTCIKHSTNHLNNGFDNSHNDNNNENLNDYDDDTRPLPNDLTGAIVCSKSEDYFSPLLSPKLISTAVIILRSPSSIGHTEITRLSTVQVHSNSSAQPTNECALQEFELTNEQNNSLILNQDSFSYELRELNASSFPSSEDQQEHGEDQPDKQIQKTNLKEVFLTDKPNEQLNCMDGNIEELVKDCTFFESETCIQKDESFVRTIAEYNIGMPSEYESLIHEKLFTEYPVEEITGQHASTSVKDIKDYAADFQRNYPDAPDSQEFVGSQSSHCKTPYFSSSDDPSLSSKEILQENRNQQSQETEIDHKLQGCSASEEDHENDVTNVVAFLNGNYTVSMSESFGFAVVTSDTGDCGNDDKSSDATTEGEEKDNEKRFVSGTKCGNTEQESDVSSVVGETTVELRSFYNGDISGDSMN